MDKKHQKKNIYIFLGFAGKVVVGQPEAVDGDGLVGGKIRF
jgi:hypothetical protein